MAGLREYEKIKTCTGDFVWANFRRSPCTMLADEEMAGEDGGGNENGCSGAPTAMPKFNKRAKPQLRKRRKSDSDEERKGADDGIEVKVIPAAAVKEKKEGGGEAKKKSLKKSGSASLSFEMEGEDE
eukprot:703507-Rhodomonas_salina.1